MSDWFTGRRGSFGPALEVLQSELNRALSDFGSFAGQRASGGAASPPAAATASGQVTVDVLRTPGGDYEIHAELPGLERDEIDLSVDGNLLTLAGERRVERDGSRGQWRVRERSAGTFSRTLALPFEATPDQIDATLENGVLTVRARRPKAEARSGSKIDIRSGGAGVAPVAEAPSAGGGAGAAETSGGASSAGGGMMGEGGSGEASRSGGMLGEGA